MFQFQLVQRRRRLIERKKGGKKLAIRRVDKLRRRIKERWTKECSFESLRWFVITVCVCVYNDTGKFPQTWRGELIGVYNLITAIQVGEEHPKV